MEKLIVLNHKMGLNYDEVLSYINSVNSIETEHNIIICPSSIYLETFVNNSFWGIGSQDVSSYLDVNHTGSISTNMLKSMGVEYSLVGHKEVLDSKKEVKEKLEAVMDANIIPILCISSINDMDLIKDIKHIEFIIFAYEPKVYEESKLKEIYDYLYERYNVSPCIIYGGNVNKDNINSLFKNEYLSGVLIGSISSSSKEVISIIDSIKE